MPRVLVAIIAVIAVAGGAYLWLETDQAPSPESSNAPAAPAQQAAPAPAPAPTAQAAPVAVPAQPTPATAPAAPEGSIAAMLSERTLGAADAPVVMQEFSSLNCPHCANFHKDTWPKIKAAYVDTGKVRLIARDFPLGDVAMDAHMLARCVAPSRYFGMVDAIFATQASWRASADPRADLIRIAQLAGLSQADAKACLANDALRTGLAAARAVASDKHGISGTPSFLIGDVKIPGALGYEDFQDIIDKALAKKGVK